MTSDEYRQAIGELRRGAAMPDGTAARVEARLREAFDTAAARPEEPVQRQPDFRSLAAAAAIVIAAGAGVWYAGRQPITSNNVTIGAADGKAVAQTTVAPARRDLKADAPDGGRSSAGGVRLPPSPRLRRTAAASAEAGQADQAGRKLPKRLPPVIRPQGFVAVPTAAGLPRFESGVIVRMSLPVTALPSYGVDISPASSDEPVEADVLIGQDGLARAIRLVNTSRSQQ